MFWHRTTTSALSAAKSNGKAWCSNLTKPSSIYSFFNLLKIEVWKVAQWGQVRDEKTYTVTLASGLPMLNILLSAWAEKINTNIKTVIKILLISFIKCFQKIVKRTF